MEGKSKLRIYAKNLRKNLPMADISIKLAELIKQTKIYKNSHSVMLFYPTEHEVDLKNLLSDDKNFYLPRVKGQDLEVCPYKDGDELKKSDFCIYEPVSNPVVPEVLDLVIVPALLCDEHGYRLGYGGGYYDRFLAKIPDAKTIIALPKELYVEDLPHESHDIKVDEVICI